jgi:ankyrin repeat protein
MLTRCNTAGTLPVAAQQQDAYSWTPLHLGLENNAPTESIRAVMQAWPHAALERDVLGRTPLHLAMENNCAADSVAAVVDACPAAAKEKSLTGACNSLSSQLQHYPIVPNCQCTANR